MRRGAADGAPIPYLGIADLGCGARQQRQLLLEQVGELDVVMAGQRADRDMAILFADVIEVADAADVDQEGRRGEAQLHERDEAMPAGEDLRLLAVLDQLCNRFRKCAGDDVIECGWNHRFAPPLRCISAQSFCGVAGIATSLTPNGSSASTMAFMTAGVEAIVPASPMPLVPSGVTGLRVMVDASSKDGTSEAVGIR